MKTFENYGIIEPRRNGIVDVWNAFMVEGADFSTNNHDVPFSPTTATFRPEAIIDWCEARELYKDAVARRDKNFYSNAFVCFFIDDKKFADDGSLSDDGYETISQPFTISIIHPIPKAMPMSRTASATIHAMAHCQSTTENAHLLPSSLFMDATAATHGV